jgi:hypothetical protein
MSALARPDSTVTEGDAMTLAAIGFTDPGVADTHGATIDWGDGTVDAGVGTVTGRHVYAAPGAFTVEVCVRDDDGGSGCDSLSVEVADDPCPGPNLLSGVFSERDVDVGAYAAPIAAGVQGFFFAGYVRTSEEVPSDAVRIVVEYRDVANTWVLDVFDSGDLSSPGAWTRVEDERLAPAGTGWIRVRLLASEENDGFVDALELRSLRTRTLGIGDVTVYEGPSGSAAAVFPVTLSCPFPQPVTVSYATADGLAVEAEDYLATAGSLTFPVGETTATVTVSVVGDEEHELHESFFVDLGDAVPAEVVLLDPRGEGWILNDDFCPRSPGFWKTHEELWPTDHLRIGDLEYGMEPLREFLAANARDATLALARQLVATKLNLLVGSDPFILATVAAADAFLSEHPPGSHPLGEARREAIVVKDELDVYNNLFDCAADPVIPSGG